MKAAGLAITKVKLNGKNVKIDISYVILFFA